MKNDYQGTLKIRQALEQGAMSLDSSIAARLAQARNNALEHQAVAVAGLSLAGGLSRLGDIILPGTRRFAAIAALTVGIVGTYYWNAFEQADENEEVDSALLADDLPVNAYTDQGFEAWLEHSSQSSAQ